MCDDQKIKNITIVNSITPEEKRCFKTCYVYSLKSMLASPDCTSSMTVLPLKNEQRKTDMLSELALSGIHANQLVWVISQRYISVLKDLRKQTKLVCLFNTKDRDSF